MKKKLFTGVLATLACFTCLTGCDQLLTPMGHPQLGESSGIVSDSSILDSNTSDSDILDSTPDSSVGDTDANLDEVKEYAEDYFRSQLFNKSNREDFTLTNTLSYDGKYYALTWSVNVESGVTVNASEEETTIVVEKTLTEDLQYTLTVTIADPDDSSISTTVSFNRIVEAAPSKVPAAITKNPEEGVAYKMHIYHVDKQKDLYLNGRIKSEDNPWYLSTTDNFDYAIDVFVEAVEGEEGMFYMFHNGEDGNSKKYINAYKTDTNHISNFYEDAPSAKWFFDSEIGTMVTEFENKEGVMTKFYLGCDSGFETVSPQDTSANMAKLIEMVDRTEVSEADKIAQTVKELSIASVYVGEGELELAAVGATYPEANIAWTIKSGEGAEIVNNSLIVAQAPTVATEIVLTATVSCGDATEATKDLTVKFIPNEVEAIIDALFDLKAGDSFANEVTLTGIVSAFTKNGEFNEQYGNVSIEMRVAYGATYKTIGCYRLTGVDAVNVSIGDTLTAKGILTNYNGTKQFGQGCTIETLVNGEEADVPTMPTMSPAEIVDAAYALNDGESLDGTQTLTGKIISIDDAYNSQYSNVTVTIEIEGKEDKPIKCYRMKGGETLAVGDVITVTGTLKNYNGTIEFDSGCTYTGEGSGTVTPPASGEDVKVPVAITSTPAVGTAYKLFLVHGNTNKTLYVKGGMDGFYFATSENADDAIDFFVEETTGGFYLYHNTGAKTYVTIARSEDGAHINLLYTTDASTVWTFDATLGTLVTTFEEEAYCLGTRNDKEYSTISANKVSYEPFLACLGLFDTDEEVTPPETPDEGGEDVAPVLAGTLTFDDTAKRSEFTTDKQIWVSENITFVNEKASSSSNVADYSNPVRCYKGSNIQVNFVGMKKIVFNCNTASYAEALAASANAASITATVEDKCVTYTFATAVDSFSITSLNAQIRINSIEVFA